MSEKQVAGQKLATRLKLSFPHLLARCSDEVQGIVWRLEEEEALRLYHAVHPVLSARMQVLSFECELAKEWHRLRARFPGEKAPYCKKLLR